MSGWLIAVTGLIYFYVSLEQLSKGNNGMCITYLGYAFSNIGLYLLASRQEYNMKEPTKFDMSTGEPSPEDDKKRPLPSIEQELHAFIEESKEWIRVEADNAKKE